ncbi:MAG: DMT family transporter [Planctomycetes bacterium]|nr:DMT family transporter [Planctomycetota bacterium]
MISSTLASFAALGAAFTWGLGSLLFSRSLAHVPAREPLSPAAANLFKNLLALGLFAGAAIGLGEALPPLAAWPRLLVSGAFGFALGDTLYFAALPRIGVQKSAMLGELNVPFTASLSFVFLGERFAPWLLAAMAVVLLGVTVVVSEAPKVDSAPSSRARAGVACAIGAALFQSLGVLVGHAGMEGAGVLGGTIVRMLGGCAAAFAVAPIGAWIARERPTREWARLVRPITDRALWKPLGLAALFGSVLGLPLFHLALRELDPGLAMVLFATTPLFTLPITRFFGEHHGARAWIGSWLGFAGVAWIVWLVQR